MQLEGKCIILTGAASGIGLAILTRLAARELKIVAVDIDAERLDQASCSLVAPKAELQLFVGDLTQEASIDALFDFAQESLGNVDLFIANAGFAYYEKIQVPDWVHIERIYQLNVFSPLYAALKMKTINPDRPYRVVITTSAMGLLALPGYALYSSTKAALDRFAESYRFELDDPAALSLVYPIGTRTSFFKVAASDAAPSPWPTQTADQVARAVISGIERDQKCIYPSLFFRVFIRLNNIFPFLGRIEQWLENRRFQGWLQQNQPTLVSGKRI